MPKGDDKRSWKKFQNLNFNSKRISRQMRRAETATTRHARKFVFRRLDSIREVRRHIVSWLVLVAILIAATAFQIVWFEQSYQTVAASTGGVYAEADLGPIDTLDPLYASSDAEIAASRLMFSSLYQYDTTGHLGNDLAQKMTLSSDHKTYTVMMRNDAKWHDGTKVTAEDVVFTINLIKNPETRSPLRVNWQDISVKKINDTTVTFTLPDVYAAFSSALTFPILPEHALENIAPSALRESSFSRAPIGSGPFKFQFLQTTDINEQNKIIHLVANTSYYRGAPKLDRFEIHSYAKTSEIVQALRTTEVSAASSIDDEEVNTLSPHTFNVQTDPIDNGVYALFNTQKPALQDVKVRQALRLAIDTTALRKKIAGDPPALDTPYIASLVKGASSIHAPTADPKQAAQLLDQAGWTLKDGVREKDGVPLSIAITTTKNDEYTTSARFLSSAWQALGIKTSTVVVDPNNQASNFVQNTLQPRNYDVLLYEFILGADPDVYAYWHSSQIGMGGYNFANYSSPIADATLSTARSLVDPEIRDAKYRAFAQSWINDAPAIGLYQPYATYVYRKGISAMAPHTELVSAPDRFSNVLYWTVNQKSVYKTP